MSIETKSKFQADIIADSINLDGNRITTFLLKYPRFVHSEIMTHRAFSRNAASSRAIPIEKVIHQVENNCVLPVRWGKNGKGMQDHGELSKQEAEPVKREWYYAAEAAVAHAQELYRLGLHKQIVNRVLEPFVWMTTLVTATDYENFFSLRVHKDAQPEFQHLAYIMLKKYLDNTPVKKAWGEWHIPFGDQLPDDIDTSTRLKVATARAARTSYLTMDGQIDIEKDIVLHDRLAESGHWSPFEHSAVAVKEMGIEYSPNRYNFPNEYYRDTPLRFGNFGDGWQQYRQQFPNENRKCDLHKLLSEYEASLNEI